MKEIIETKIIYICKTCNKTHNYKKDAIICAKTHACEHEHVRYELTEGEYKYGRLRKICTACYKELNCFELIAIEYDMEKLKQIYEILESDE